MRDKVAIYFRHAHSQLLQLQQYATPQLAIKGKPSMIYGPFINDLAFKPILINPITTLVLKTFLDSFPYMKNIVAFV
jgi:hypothetical protein